MSRPVLAEDPVARGDAALARQQIDKHEEHCAERWAEARDQIAILHARVSEARDAMERGTRRITWALIAGQGSLLLLLAGSLLAGHL